MLNDSSYNDNAQRVTTRCLGCWCWWWWPPIHAAVRFHFSIFLSLIMMMTCSCCLWGFIYFHMFFSFCNYFQYSQVWWWWCWPVIVDFMPDEAITMIKWYCSRCDHTKARMMITVTSSCFLWGFLFFRFLLQYFSVFLSMMTCSCCLWGCLHAAGCPWPACTASMCSSPCSPWLSDLSEYIYEQSYWSGIS